MGMCDHSGAYNGEARYLRDAGELRLVLICEGCGAEREELGRIPYRPDARSVDAPAGLGPAGLTAAEPRPAARP